MRPLFLHRTVIRRFGFSRQGTALIEFSILAPLFFAVIFSGFEAGMMYMKISTVEHGVSEVSRQIYTGAADGDSREEILDVFCGAVDSVMQCDDNVTLEVRKLDLYGGFEPGPPTCQNSGDPLADDEQPDFDTTRGGDIVYLRVCITTDLLVPGLKNLTFSMVNVGLQLPESAPGKYQLSSAVIIRNEPF